MGTAAARTAGSDGRWDEDAEDSSRNSPSSEGSERMLKFTFEAEGRLWRATGVGGGTLR
jgi:hypothetical protein